jgi:hypothetical protein
VAIVKVFEGAGNISQIAKKILAMIAMNAVTK